MSDALSVDRIRSQPVPLVPLPDRDRLGVSLPAPLTSFIGREREVAAVAGLLRQDGVRLVTLTGPGGVGKTRLALRVTEALALDADGVTFVPLAPISDPTHVAPTIAQALGVGDAGGSSLAQALAVALRDRRFLLVLDNFEQVVEAAPLVAHLLGACLRLTVLVTSRAPLRVAGEHEVHIPPLTLPDPADPPAQEAGAEAVRFFAERARTVDPAFELTAENAPTIAAICARLDGLPLALELAAARTRLLPPHALLPRLARRLPLLRGGPREAPARLRTMNDAIAWSYDLLSLEEQDLFRRLAVFVGGFTLDAAEAVCHDLGLDAIAGVESLVEQSLVRRLEAAPRGAPTGEPEPRFGMLETVREFGLERLAEHQEMDAARARHADWGMAMAEAAAPEPTSPPGSDLGRWLAQFDAELPNLRSMLGWLLEGGRALDALRLLAWTDEFWTSRALYRDEVRRWVTAGLAAAPEAPPALRAAAFHLAVCATATLGHRQVAVDYAQEAVAIARPLGDPFVLGRAYYDLGLAWEFDGEGERAAAAYEQAAALFRQIDSASWTAAALGGLGDMRHWCGDAAGAALLLDEGLALFRQKGSPWGIALLLGQRAFVARSQGDLALAARLFAESLAVEREIGNEWIALGAVAGLAGVAASLGQRFAATDSPGATQRVSAPGVDTYTR